MRHINGWGILFSLYRNFGFWISFLDQTKPNVKKNAFLELEIVLQ